MSIGCLNIIIVLLCACIIYFACQRFMWQNNGDQLYKPHHVLDMTNYITSLIDKWDHPFLVNIAAYIFPEYLVPTTQPTIQPYLHTDTPTNHTTTEVSLFVIYLQQCQHCTATNVNVIKISSFATRM